MINPFFLENSLTNQSLHRTDFLRGYLIALTSAAVLSTTAIFIRYLTTVYNIPALVLAFWRDLFVILLLFPLLGLVRPALLRLTGKDPVFLFFYGLVLAFFNALWTLSVSLNGAAVATVLAYSSTAFSVLLGWWLLKERLDWAKILVVFLCLGGCILVAGAIDPQAWRMGTSGMSTSGMSNPVGILAGIFFWGGICGIWIDGTQGLAARLESVDNPSLHFCLCHLLSTRFEPGPW